MGRSSQMRSIDHGEKVLFWDWGKYCTNCLMMILLYSYFCNRENSGKSAIYTLGWYLFISFFSSKKNHALGQLLLIVNDISILLLLFLEGLFASLPLLFIRPSPLPLSCGRPVPLPCTFVGIFSYIRHVVAGLLNHEP